MKIWILLLMVLLISLSCKQIEERKKSKEKSRYEKLANHNDQIFKKLDEFYQYKSSLIDTNLKNGICKIELTTHDPYGISSGADTFIIISMLYCDQIYEEFKGAFIYDRKMNVVLDKEDLARIFLSNVELFLMPKDSITCVNMKTKTVFSYIVKNGKLKEWIFPFK